MGYEMRRCSTEVAFSAVSKRNSRLPPAVKNEVLDSRRGALVSLFCSAYINKMRQANVFYTVEEVTFLKKVAREQKKESEDKGYCSTTAVSMYQHEREAAFFGKRVAEV